MRRDLAVRGAALTAFTAVSSATLGFIVADDGASPGAWWFLVLSLTAIGLIAGYLAFRRTSRTLREITRAADRISEGELSQTVSASTGSTAAVASSFNHMAARIVELFQETIAEHARLEAVFDASTDPMVAVSRDTTVRFLNSAAEALLETSQGQAIGRPFIETARDYELDALVRRAAALEAPGEARVVTFGRGRTPLRALAVPIAGGGDWAVLLILVDLTDVQRIDQVRRDFLSNVSHELRTPLASIRALVETIQEGDVDTPEELAEFHGRIRQQVDRLTTLVNELLDLSRIESGAIELHPEPVDLAAVVQEAAALLQPRATEYGITIDLPAPVGITVEADRASLLRV
ncbi:MAG TPA: histidine kinase dimerization/phospho-acceptor domain-containing protein, partial [Tepidiformaceae bacterium]|nr:histidine kinase dimerization/phospho-acceptor domain-containing protein [Tepidiformaceae bacterium]